MLAGVVYGYIGGVEYIIKKMKQEIGRDAQNQLLEEIELLDGASAEFDQQLVTKG